MYAIQVPLLLPFSAACNFTYICSGLALLMFPCFTGRELPGQMLLMALLLALLGVASFAHHAHGDLLGDWAHRADMVSHLPSCRGIARDLNTHVSRRYSCVRDAFFDGDG